MAATSPTDQPAWDAAGLRDVLMGLGSREPEIREASAVRLHKFALKTARRLEGAEMDKFVKQLFDDVCALLASKTRTENLGAIAAILELARVARAGVTTTGVRLHMFGRHLLKVFPPLGSDIGVITEAARAMGQLAHIGLGPMTDKFVAMLADKALEWLEHATVRNEAKRYGAALILGELCRARSSSFFPFIPRVFKFIFVALHDIKESVRQTGAETLRTCLRVWRGRGLYPGLYHSIELGMSRMSREEAVHGSLMASAAFVELTGDYIFETNYFESICDAALKATSSRSSIVRQEVLGLLTLLARGKPQAFLRYAPQGKTSFAQQVFEHLRKCITKDRERGPALAAYGRLALALGPEILPQLPAVFRVMRVALTPRKGGSRPPSEAAVAAVCWCVADLVTALGPLLETDLSMPPEKGGDGPSFVDLLFAVPLLSPPLVEALAAIATHIPLLAPDVRRRSLDSIAAVLQDAPYRHPGAPQPPEERGVGQGGEGGGDLGNSRGGSGSGGSGGLSSKSKLGGGGTGTGEDGGKGYGGSRRGSLRPGGGSDLLKSGGGGQTGDGHYGDGSEAPGNARLNAVLMALRALTRLEFDGHVLTSFARASVVPLLRDEDASVRESAAAACAHVVVPATNKHSTIQQQQARVVRSLVNPATVTEVLAAVLDLAICDRKRHIRQGILDALAPHLDPYLAKVSLLRRLCSCMHDQDFGVCQAAVGVVCRLAVINPAHALPSLRRYLVALLAGMGFRGLERSETENAIVLGQLVRAAPRLVCPYSDALMTALLPKLDLLNTSVSQHALATMGDLAALAPIQAQQHRLRLMIRLAATLRDPRDGGNMHQVALEVMAKICRASSYAVDPYTEYPELMGLLFACLGEDREQSIRDAASRTLGVLGAISPHRYRAIAAAAQARADATRPGRPEQPDNIAQRGLSTSMPDLHPHAVGTEEYYMDIVVGEVMGLVYDPTLRNLHDHIVRCLGIMCVKAGPHTVAYLPQIVPALLHVANVGDKEAQRHAVHQLSKFIDIFGVHMRPFLPRIVSCIQQHWLAVAVVVGSGETGGGGGGGGAGGGVEAGSRSAGSSDGSKVDSKPVSAIAGAVTVSSTDGMAHSDGDPAAAAAAAATAEALKRSGKTPVTSAGLHTAVMNVFRSCGNSIGRELQAFVPDLLNHIMPVLAEDDSEARLPSHQVLEALGVLAPLLGDSFQSVVYAVIAVYADYVGVAAPLRRRALNTMACLVRTGHLQELTFSVVHSLCRLLRFEPDLRHDILGALQPIFDDGVSAADMAHHRRIVGAVVGELGLTGEEIAAFGFSEGGFAGSDGTRGSDGMGGVGGIIEGSEMGGSGKVRGRSRGKRGGGGGFGDGSGKDRVGSGTGTVVGRDKGGFAGGGGSGLANRSQRPSLADPSEMQAASARSFNRATQVRVLGLAAEAGRAQPTFDWVDWIRRFSLTLLKESRSVALASFQDLAMHHDTFARRLFNAAFVSSWVSLTDEQQAGVTDGLERAMMGSHLFMQMMLNAIEFMSHHFSRVRLPLSNLQLGNMALESHAYAKALRYKEAELRSFFDQATLYSGEPPTAISATPQLFRVVEDLIEINQALQEPRAARGVLAFMRTRFEGGLDENTVQPSWYEKLGQWDLALDAYNARLAAASSLKNGSSDGTAGSVSTSLSGIDSSSQAVVKAALSARVRRMHCLDRLCKYEELQMEVATAWREAHLSGNGESGSSDGETGRMLEGQLAGLAGLGCSAAAGLGDWDAIATYVNMLDTRQPDSAFNRALLAVHRGESETARAQIEAARRLLNPQLTALWGESYARAYPHVVTLQLLSELEEALEYKAGNAETRARIRVLWAKRINGCRMHPNVWQRILEVRSLVLTAEDNAVMQLKYAALCRKRLQEDGTDDGGSALGLDRSHRILVGLLGGNPRLHPECALPTSDPQVTYAYIKHTWLSGHHDEALHHLYRLIDHLGAEGGAGSGGSIDGSGSMLLAPQQGGKVSASLRGSATSPSAAGAAASQAALLARCYHKCAQWEAAPLLSHSGGSIKRHTPERRITSVIESFRCATMYDRSWFKAWQSWALMNFQAVAHYRATQQKDAIVRHAVMAVKGFFNAIALRPSTNLQDTLRLLKLLYELGHYPDVARTIAAGMSTVSADTWLHVLPQLIARIQISDVTIRGLLHDLLLSIGRAHPQSVLFPLTVAAHNNAAGVRRKEAAEALLRQIRVHSNELVEQALMVSEELIRVAVLWNEMWHEGLEEASKLSTEHDIEGMFSVLAPLHARISEAGREATVKEAGFIQAFGKDLQEAWDWCCKYQRSGNPKDLTAAWDHYYHVYRDISKQLPQLTALELREVSPKLLHARDLQLAVPGTYMRSEKFVSIASFSSQLLVISSKQRPRRLTVRGSDGREYQYLLKAHEDLRQDERVMQLFSLVNALLASDTAFEHNGRNAITTFFVLPLSPTLGLIEWVPTCDTFHSVIRDHRERNGIVLNVEVRLQLQMTPDYASLTTIQKVEVFRYALSKTPGDDLGRVLWLQSRDAETWLERRQNYTRSLAVMSMVGYILGLGDRHPSNLTLDRKTGDVMHVDFGDCFEVAMHRAKFPEKVPFRLTRMMVAAMEVSGVEGTFRGTCETVMAALRREGESLMAVLEAFVHDPLIDWFVKVRGVNALRGEEEGEEEDYEYGGGDGGEHNSYDKGADLEEGAAMGGGGETPNSKAQEIIDRVRAKLGGYDFRDSASLDPASQVKRLIAEATSAENLCQHYLGWCPFW